MTVCSSTSLPLYTAATPQQLTADSLIYFTISCPMFLAASSSHLISSQIPTHTSTPSLPVLNFHTSQNLPQDMAQPNSAVNFGPNLPSEIWSPELGLLVFHQDDPSANFEVQVGTFEPQPYGAGVCSTHDPWPPFAWYKCGANKRRK